MLDWLFKRIGKSVPIEVEEDKRTLINVYSENIQAQIFEDYGVRVPMFSTFCTKELFSNSSLWFEMWQPSKEYLNK